MATPAFFDYETYMTNKLAQVQNADPAAGWTMTKLMDSFAQNGFVGADGAYAHFVQFGAAEEIAPNADFNANEYYAAKAAQFYGVEPKAVTEFQIANVKQIITSNGMNAWTHYQQFGSAEGVNPSNAFDADAYLAAKAVAMGDGWTAEKVAEAIKGNGMTVLEHYLQYAGTGENEVAKGATYPVPDDQKVPSSVTSTTYDLTVGQDSLSGTIGNDTFNAFIFDNQNTLQSGDRIDGGAGHDVLNADLGTSALFAATPEIKNVEVIKFRAQANAADNGSNNVANDAAARIDAERIQAGDDGKLQLWSQDSRADLVIEDVRVNSNNMTIGMGNTDSGDVDMTVYFNDQYLKSEDATTTGTLSLQLIDTVGALTEAQGGHADPLYDNPYTGFKFTLDGKEYTVDFKAYNHNTDETPTYAELAAQIQAAINADATLSKLGLTVTLDGTFDAVVGIGDHKGTTVTGEKIVVTSSNGALSGGTWLASNGLPETNSTSATMSSDQVNSCPLIKTNVALDNVGQVQWDDAHAACLPDESVFGSQAGDLVIGGMGTRGGVERFDVTVERGSWLSSMSSTNNTLRMVTVKNGDTGNDGVDAGNGMGQLFIGDTLQEGNAMTAWQDAPRLLSTDGLTDVKTFDASAMGGTVNIGAQITSASYDKYLKDVDGVEDKNNSATNGDFSYKTGTGNDTVNMAVDGRVAGDNDFRLNIETNAGNDLVNFSFNGFTANQLANQMALNNVSIATGAGDDIVKFWGDGAVKVDGGAGNDAIYVGQNGADHNAVWVMNSNADHWAIYSDPMKGVQSLNNDVLSTAASFAYTGATAGESLQVTVSFKGITVTANIGTMNAATGSFTAEQVNAAIISAINNDATLSKLLAATDGAGHSLLVESLIDGKMDAGDLTFNFAAVKADGTVGTNPTTTTLDTAYGAASNHFAVYGQEVASASNISEGGSANEVQHLVLDGSTAIAMGDTFSITIDGKVYTTEALAGDGVDALVTALNVAKDSDGATLSGVTIAKDGSNIKLTWGDTTDHQNGTTLFKSGEHSGEATGTDIGTTSHNTVIGGEGNDVLVLGAGANNVDHVVLSGNFGNDTVMNFATTVDKFDVSAYNAQAAIVGTAVSNLNSVTEYNSTTLGSQSVVAGTNIIFIENDSTDTFYVFKIDSADAIFDVNDSVSLLGTVTTADGTIVTGDIIHA
mgnify:CR=1 FL=1